MGAKGQLEFLFPTLVRLHELSEVVTSVPQKVNLPVEVLNH